MYDAGPTRVHRARAVASWVVGDVLPELHAAAADTMTAAAVAMNDDANRSVMTVAGLQYAWLIQSTMPNPGAMAAVTMWPARSREETGLGPDAYAPPQPTPSRRITS